MADGGAIRNLSRLTFHVLRIEDAYFEQPAWLFGVVSTIERCDDLRSLRGFVAAC